MTPAALQQLLQHLPQTQAWHQLPNACLGYATHRHSPPSFNCCHSSKHPPRHPQPPPLIAGHSHSPRVAICSALMLPDVFSITQNGTATTGSRLIPPRIRGALLQLPTPATPLESTNMNVDNPASYDDTEDTLTKKPRAKEPSDSTSSTMHPNQSSTT
jgi:hypothetical protein